MGKANKQENNSKPKGKVSIFHGLLVLVGADLILLFAPEFGIANSMIDLSYRLSLPAVIAGLALVIFGFRGFISKL